MSHSVKQVALDGIMLSKRSQIQKNITCTIFCEEVKGVNLNVKELLTRGLERYQ